MTQNRSILTLGSSFVQLTATLLPGTSATSPSFQFVVGAARVLSTDIRARNGVIHSVSEMLLSTLEVRSPSPSVNPTQVMSFFCCDSVSHSSLTRRFVNTFVDAQGSEASSHLVASGLGDDVSDYATHASH